MSNVNFSLVLKNALENDGCSNGVSWLQCLDSSTNSNLVWLKQQKQQLSLISYNYPISLYYKYVANTVA